MECTPNRRFSIRVISVCPACLVLLASCPACLLSCLPLSCLPPACRPACRLLAVCLPSCLPLASRPLSYNRRQKRTAKVLSFKPHD